MENKYAGTYYSVQSTRVSLGPNLQTPSWRFVFDRLEANSVRFIRFIENESNRFKKTFLVSTGPYVFDSPVNLLFFRPLKTGIYPGITRTRHVCEFCTAVIPVPGISVNYARPCRDTRGTGTTYVYLPGTSVSYVWHSYPYPELLRVLQDIHTRTRNFCEVCTIFIPVPGTRVSTVCLCHNTRGTG